MQGVSIRVLCETLPSYTLTLVILFFVTTDFAVDKLIGVAWSETQFGNGSRLCWYMVGSSVEQIYVWQ